MKKIIISLFLFSSTSHLVSMQKPLTVELTKKRCTSCKQNCVNVCEQVKANHKNLILQLNVFHKMEVAKAYGNPCETIETDGLEKLFEEKQETFDPKPAVFLQRKSIKMFMQTESDTTPVPPLKKESSSQYSDIDSLLHELEKALPKESINKQLTFTDHIKELAKLIRRGSSEIAILIKPESTDAALNNLDVTCQELQKENDQFEVIIKAASATEKSENEFLRLCLLVNQAVESSKRLGSKEPLVSYLDDITHPFNSYQNEIQLLQLRLTQK